MIHKLELGQHFLQNAQTLDLMLSHANIQKNEHILEIGAGEGVLSEKLATLCDTLQIIEIDSSLKELLSIKLGKYKNTHIIYQNALQCDFKPYDKIITSLPYNILEPFLHKCIQDKVPFILMLIGDKYALSLRDFEISEKYNYVQLLSYAFFDFEVHEFVPRTHFNPPPKTGSFIVSLTKTQTQDLQRKILQELFLQTNKKLKNALIQSVINVIDCTQRQSKAIIQSFNLSEDILDSKLPNLNNSQINILYKKIKKIIPTIKQNIQTL